LTIQFLKYIVTVAESGSITEAARKLHISDISIQHCTDRTDWS